MLTGPYGYHLGAALARLRERLAQSASQAQAQAINEEIAAVEQEYADASRKASVEYLRLRNRAR